MNFETQLARRLDDALADLPALPPDDYLRRGQRARRRRRRAVGVAALAVVALGASLSQLAPGGPESEVEYAGPGSVEGTPSGMHRASRDRDDVAPLPTTPVEAVTGLSGVDHFSTPDIPTWAQEYGNHGPVALAPDGRLWVAPDAEVLQTVVGPLAGTKVSGSPVTASYAVEVVFDPPAGFGGDVAWVLIYSDGDSGGVGEMDEPGRWTRDFEIWVDDVAAQVEGRPSFDERLVQVAAEGSDRLVAGRPACGSSSRLTSATARGAEVRWDGRTWFVVVHPGGGRWYQAYEPSTSAPDFASFLDWAAEEYA